MGKRTKLREIRKHVQASYVIASVVWIYTCLFLRVTKTRSYVAYAIIVFPLFIYALGYLNASKIKRYDDNSIIITDILAIALLIITIMVEMYHHNADHYTINIMITAFILLMFSIIDYPLGYDNVVLVRHIKSIMRTAAISLLTYVIFVNVTTRVPMKLIK